MDFEHKFEFSWNGANTQAVLKYSTELVKGAMLGPFPVPPFTPWCNIASCRPVQGASGTWRPPMMSP